MTSFGAADVASYRIVATKGQLHVDPAYQYAEGLAYALTVNGKTTRKRIGKRDQFAPELLYLSDCILKHREPETCLVRKDCRTCGLCRRSMSRQKPERRCRSRHSSAVSGRQESSESRGRVSRSLRW